MHTNAGYSTVDTFNCCPAKDHDPNGRATRVVPSLIDPTVLQSGHAIDLSLSCDPLLWLTAAHP
ncbi:MAG: hypothetical protein ACREQ5_01065 [Candidatus Dormibacteria bacterium]